MMRFVEIWTLQRGVLKRPHVLDAMGQAAAFDRWLADEPRRFDPRVTVLGAEDPQRVVWSVPAAKRKRPVRVTQAVRIERMLELARKVMIA